MRIVLCSVFFCLLGFTVMGQDFSKQSLKELLESTRTNPLIIVEGYYVDNSSFMVARLSDVAINEDKRYPVYEYKIQERLYTKAPDGKVEVPVFTKSGTHGKKYPRILFVNKKRSNDSQLVVEEAETLGLPIVEDRVEYSVSVDGSKEWVSLDDLRDFLFNDGVMPEISQIENLVE